MSYATVDYANTYFGTRLHTGAWDDASLTNREKALAQATRDIDRLDYIDDPVSDDAAFPRGDDTEAPDDIKIANCEIAMALLDGVDVDAELEAMRVISDKIGGVQAKYNMNVPEHIEAGIASATAWRYLKPYLREDQTVRISRVS